MDHNYNYNNSRPNENTDSNPSGFTGETDRSSGEYHYKNGYTQKIYSDAHYVPYEENTVPPRYYTPPEKPVKEPKPPKKKKGGWIKVMCLCLVCALLGGVAGGILVEEIMEERLDLLEDRLEEAKELQAVQQTQTAQPQVQYVSDNGMLASDIYDLACKQVVGITSEVTYTNFFGMQSSSAVSGSGFIVSENGYIITNYHVIEYAYQGKASIEVILHDGTRYEASIIGAEESNDIAVLKIEASNLSAATLGDSDSLQVGDRVYAVGNPLGELEFSMTTGYVSALDRLITTDETSDSINMFQIDAAVNSGNSGGPVYNSQGQVIGVVTAKYSDTGVEGLGFAIPINDAASISNDLITKGYVTGKAYMGIRLDERYNSMYSQYYGMPLGAYVYSVDSGSCAETAGLRAGDIITALGENEIKGMSDLKQAIKQFSAGETTEITLYRAGEELKMSITFDEAKPDSVADSPAKFAPAG